MLWFLIHLILGLYFINLASGFITLPAFSADISNAIFFIGGIFIILGGIMHIMKKKKGKDFDIKDLVGK